MVTLPELFWLWKERATASEIYFWYVNAVKCIKKRTHPVGSQLRRDAGALRKKETGRYGFPRGPPAAGGHPQPGAAGFTSV